MAVDLNPDKTPHLDDHHYDEKAISDALKDCVRDWIPKLFPRAVKDGKTLRVGNIQGDAGESLVIQMEGEFRGSYKDHGNGKGGGPLALLGRALNLSGRSLFEHAVSILGHDPSPQKLRTRARTLNGAGHAGAPLANGHADTHPGGGAAAVPVAMATTGNGHVMPATGNATAQPEQGATATNYNYTQSRNISLARFVVEHSVPVAGTLAETYLISRGLVLPNSKDILFNESCTHSTFSVGMPALIARWRNVSTGELTGGIHRTYLKADGSGHIGKKNKAKLSLGPSDGVVMLGEPGITGDLLFGEGLETVLAGAALFKEVFNPAEIGGGINCWYGGTSAMRLAAAAFDAGTFGAFLESRAQPRYAFNPITGLSVALATYPGPCARLLVLVDKGRAGIEAAEQLALAADRAGIEGWIALPASGDDFAEDLARGLTPAYPIRIGERLAQTSVPVAPKLGKRAGTAHSGGNSLSSGLPVDRVAEVIERFNRDHVIVHDGRSVVYRENFDSIRKRNVIQRISFEDLKKLYQNELITKIDDDGKSKTRSSAEWWLFSQSRKQFLNGIVFDPTNSVDNTKYLNLWKGYGVESIDGDWSLLDNHMREVICNGDYSHYEYLIGWIARMFQFPQFQGEVATVLRGKKGTGKGTLANILAKIWGQHSLHISNARHLIGNFNLHLRDVIFLFADEAFYAGDRQHESVLKSLITETTLIIEGKGQNVVEATNMLHIMMASNSEWVVPVSNDERRYFVLDVNDKYMGNREYFRKLYEQMENGGLSAALHYFLNVDISRYEVRDIPNTRALQDQKENSMDAIDAWWYEVLHRGYVLESKFAIPEFNKWMEWVSVDLLKKSYIQWCNKKRKNYPPSDIMLVKRLKEMYQHGRSSWNEIIGEAESFSNNYDPIIKIARPRGFRIGDIDTASRVFYEKRGIEVYYKFDEEE